MENCHKCHKPLRGEVRRAMNNNYHPQCFTCQTCDQPIVGNVFHVTNGKPICDTDYRRTLVNCSVCRTPITGRVLHALGNKYHQNCFRCTVCHLPVVGQKFFSDVNKQIYCMKDYGLIAAKVCNRCKQAIVPENGRNSSDCVVSLNKYYHMRCFKCEVCGVLLSNNDKNRECHPLGENIFCFKCFNKKTN